MYVALLFSFSQMLVNLPNAESLALALRLILLRSLPSRAFRISSENIRAFACIRCSPRNLSGRSARIWSFTRVGLSARIVYPAY